MLLEARDVSFTYPSAQQAALKGVSLTVERGAFVTICGASGCGKSTLLHMLKPCLMPRGAFSGEVLFCGEELSALDPRRAAAEIGFVAQDPDASVVTDRVWHEIAFGAESVGTPPDELRRRVAECAEYFGLERLFDRETAGLSGGEKQLVSLAAAALIFGWILADLIPAFSVMRELMERAALSSEVVKILIKALGVCCLCELAGQVCREAGQLAIASKIDLAGKVTILLLALPLFRELLELSLSLMDR